jgi:polysaccharide export outer membrane protein
MIYRFRTLCFTIGFILFSGLCHAQQIGGQSSQQFNLNQPTNLQTGRSSLLKNYYSSFTKKRDVLENLSFGGSLGSDVGNNSFLEEPVDETRYILGPGDQLEIGITGAAPLQLPALVNAEGNLIVSTVGEFKLAGKKLVDAKKEIIDKAKTQYANASIAVSLQRPRTFAVTVVGAVRLPGKKTAAAVDRVEKVIIAASTIQEGQDPEKQSQEYQTGVRNYQRLYPDAEENLQPSLRKIIVKHRDGSENAVDLISYYMTGDTRYNPYLQDGDVVSVPNRKSDDGETVGIYGAVRIGGLYEYSPTDSLSTLVKIAQGFTKNADPTALQLVRSTPKGFEAKQINAADILAKRSPDIALLPQDRIQVKERTDRRTGNVTVKGEVNYAGYFAIEDRKTTLRDVITLAGGFTPKASLAKARIYRKPEQDDQSSKTEIIIDPDFQQATVLRTSNLDEDEIINFNSEYSIRRNAVAVDFHALFDKPDSQKDVTLYDGDIITIPKDNENIYVLGQVATPGFVPYERGQSLSYYLQKVGGETQESTGDIKILKAGSYQWKKPSETNIESGDWIFVPKKVRKTLAYTINTIAPIVSLVTGVVTLAVLIYQITKK